MTQMKTKIDIDGVLLINKARGYSSNAVLQRAKRIFNAKKAGHTGSLDPLATGMLPICFGEATKYSQYLLNADKAYRVTAKLGEKTDTSDADGKVIQKLENVNVSIDEIKQTLLRFLGLQKQVPSMYSALKHNGAPLYSYARKGVEVPREAREININSIELINFDLPYLTLEIECSKGTYIRNLVEDIGDSLGVGAHVTMLHRQYTSGFAGCKMYTTDELSELQKSELNKLLLPIEKLVEALPRFLVTKSMVQTLLLGQYIQISDSGPGEVSLSLPNGRFVGIGAVLENGYLKPKRMLQAEKISQLLS